MKKSEKFGAKNEYKKYSVLISLIKEVFRKWLYITNKAIFFDRKVQNNKFLYLRTLKSPS